MTVSQPRRCLDCGTPLPREADPRRSFCGQACVSRAYRKRVRRLDRRDRERQVIRTFAELTRIEKAGIASGYWVIPGVQCPLCGTVIWRGVRRRGDAVYCSAKCRQAAYRLRKHDVQA